MSAKGVTDLLDNMLAGDDLSLWKAAKKVDLIDRVLGPLESVLQLYGGPLFSGLGFMLETSELLFSKIPFAYRYIKHTGDFEALPGWVSREIFCFMFPYGDLIDLHNSYKNRARGIFEKKISYVGK